MKKIGWALLALFVVLHTEVTFSQANNAEEAKIKALIGKHVKAGDDRNAATFKEILNDNFRVTINGFRGQPGITVIDKNTYVSLMEGGRIGGDTRTYEITSVDVKNDIASAKTIITGTTVIFTSYYHFVKNNDGNWQLIADMPFTEPK